MTRISLGVGSRLVFDGDVYTVQGFQGPSMRMRTSNGKVALVDLQELVDTPGVDFLDEEGTRSNFSAAEWDTLPKAVKDAAQDLGAHLNEAITGFRSGSSGAPEPSEPRVAYDPAITTLTVRMEQKGIELGIGLSTLWKYKKSVETQGLLGLVDHRRSKQLSPFGRTDPRVLAAIRWVQEDLVEGSTVGVDRVRRLVERRLSERYGPGVVPMPSQSTFYRRFKQLSSGRAMTGPSKARRSIANLPDTPYRRLVASRPGEMVLIDSTPLDVYALIRCAGGFRWKLPSPSTCSRGPSWRGVSRRRGRKAWTRPFSLGT